MVRISLLAVLASVTVAGATLPSAPGPNFYMVQRGEARVFILGFGEARDTSWLTPSIRAGFDASSQVWLETRMSSEPDVDPGAKRAAAERMEKLGHESGRTLFDALEPSARMRTAAYLAELGIDPDSVKTLRPWRAYYSITSAFWQRQRLGYEPVSVQAVLETRAARAGKSLGYEFPTREAFVDFMAGMSDRAQSQYLEWLFDFFDDHKQGLYDDDETFGWIEGRRLPFRSLDRMRARAELYEAMQPRRNLWWARKIDELLKTPGTYFVAVGQLHVMGPDGIPRQLERMGVSIAPLP
jgi:uncharacterized protein YbaP (TraB family)